jgi:hypothetical protein
VLVVMRGGAVSSTRKAIDICGNRWRASDTFSIYGCGRRQQVVDNKIPSGVDDLLQDLTGNRRATRPRGGLGRPSALAVVPGTVARVRIDDVCAAPLSSASLACVAGFAQMQS